MIEDIRTYYKCEYCGNVSRDYEEIEECEKNCKSIMEELENVINSCKKLNELGCTIELRNFPFYTDNKLDKASARILKKELQFIYKSEELALSNQRITVDNFINQAIKTRD